ncbi:MAG TPA: heme anaerobic degradation radical SAM methyltransferase ChuW/HutW [Rhodocyclaceae bacterium]|nr:heme anaerobic degradation radical SAM methyltransferase ChuW/HutW [Rhodocyclaceae bacterium]
MTRQPHTMDLDLDTHFARLGGDPTLDAFQARRAVLPWRNKRPLPADQVPHVWRQLSDAGSPSPGRLAYVHVPFCANHCLFCGFYRNAHSDDAAARYADLLVAEIELDAHAALPGSAPIEAVYLGGGTPSALSAHQLERVLTALRGHLPLSEDCEITLEGRITHFDADKVEACVSAGVNRISIGIQTFDTRVRRRQGRKSSREEAIRFLESLCARNDATIVIDLLYGLPGQTPEIWHDDLRTAVALAPDGIDLYGLNLIPGTPLQRSVAAGKFPVTSTLSDRGEMYRTGKRALDAAGWEQLNNSHWRRTPRERSRYNLRIKEGMDCLAYGSGAGGQVGRYSYAVTGDLQGYADAVRGGDKPLSAIQVADDLQAARHAMTAGFEVGRLDMTVFRGIAPAASHDACDTLLRQWHAAGLLDYDGRIAMLTTAGRFWYSNLIFAFDDVLTAVTAAASPCA